MATVSHPVDYSCTLHIFQLGECESLKSWGCSCVFRIGQMVLLSPVVKRDISLSINIQYNLTWPPSSTVS